MTAKLRYELEFYVTEHGTEFRRSLGDERAHVDAKAFLDDLLGRRGPPSEHQSVSGRTSSDTYLVNEAQYRAFEEFMRRRQR